MKSLMGKFKDYLLHYSDRVTEEIAPDYRKTISQEMWFSLILRRLENNYYRSGRQLIADFDMIASNA
jgi:hypothetical protein